MTRRIPTSNLTINSQGDLPQTVDLWRNLERLNDGSQEFRLNAPWVFTAERIDSWAREVWRHARSDHPGTALV
jgi:hypothetical protein